MGFFKVSKRNQKYRVVVCYVDWPMGCSPNYEGEHFFYGINPPKKPNGIKFRNLSKNEALINAEILNKMIDDEYRLYPEEAKAKYACWEPRFSIEAE